MNKKYVVRMFSLLLEHIELTVTKDLNGALRSDLLLQKVIVTSEKINFSKIEAPQVHTIRQEATRTENDP